MAEDELLAFREHWKQELTIKNEAHSNCNDRSEPEKRQDSTSQGSSKGGQDAFLSAYVSIAEGLLDGRTSPLLERIQEERTRRKRQYYSLTSACNTSQQQPQRKINKGDKLVDQFIQDLNETNDIPFFDIELPYELALKIFQYLSQTELGRCAQVSKAWGVLAEDEVLWFRMCQTEGYHHGASVSDSPCWKSMLRDCKNSENTVRSNWKNRVGSISQLQYELGKVLCDVSSCDSYVVAGYTSGDVRLWDTLHWDSAASFLKPSPLTADVTPRPHVSHIRVNNTVAVAAYDDGCVDVWSTETGQEPVHHFQIPGRVHALALSQESPTLATAAGLDVRLDQPDERGYWRTLCQATLPKPVRDNVPLVALSAGETVYLLAPEDLEPRVLHTVYGHPITCLDASASHAALGVKSCGWAMNDGGNKIQVYSLETGQSEMSVGNSAGDFSCVNLRDSPPHMLVCGNKDRRVRVFDLRTGSSVTSLYAHHMGVTSVQADDWKIVSGGGEGLVCVWEMRMGAKLWEMHNRHPVRHLRFNTSTLVTANIPDEKSPRGACITDDDLTAHRRHRGVICHYDFSEDSTSQDHVLPICRSNYVESSGYNYNIGLAVPYDILSGSHPSH
uniref:F-box/WD repeat-containing protein 8 n=1 Tax=Salmo trutta TaxID=8032 RepID=A0A673YUP7_SALTR